jgi:hypothetical protein
MSEHSKSKGKFDYLPWAVVVKQLIVIHPDATWRFLPHTTYPDGSVMVETSVTINDITKHYILPVYSNYGGRPKAIQNPDAYAINTAYQRCLVKTIASFGLGLDIFTHDETDELYVDCVEKTEIEEPKEGLQNVSPKGQEYWATFVSEFMNTCQTNDELVDLWQANKPEIDKLKELNPEVYEMLVKSAKKVKEKIKEGK